MSDRVKILSCACQRLNDNRLELLELRLIDLLNDRQYQAQCELVDDEEDYYRIKLFDGLANPPIDECLIDSSGGVLMGDDFAYENIDEELGDEIIDFTTSYFIIPF